MYNWYDVRACHYVKSISNVDKTAPPSCFFFLLVNVGPYRTLSTWKDEPANNKVTDELPTSRAPKHSLFIDGNAIVIAYWSQHGGCWWSGAYLTPGHLQQSWWWGDALWISVVSQRQTGYKRGRLNINISYQYVRIHVVKMRRSHDRVDFIMGILYMGWRSWKCNWDGFIIGYNEKFEFWHDEH